MCNVSMARSATLHTSFSAKGHFARAAAARHAHGRGQPRASTAGEEETPAGRSKGGAGAKLLVETLMSEKNTPDGLRPGPTDDPRIDSLDKDSIRKREPLAACAAAVLFKRGSTRS